MRFEPFFADSTDTYTLAATLWLDDTLPMEGTTQRTLRAAEVGWGRVLQDRELCSQKVGPFYDWDDAPNMTMGEFAKARLAEIQARLPPRKVDVVRGHVGLSEARTMSTSNLAVRIMAGRLDTHFNGIPVATLDERVLAHDPKFQQFCLDQARAEVVACERILEDKTVCADTVDGILGRTVEGWPDSRTVRDFTKDHLRAVVLGEANVMAKVASWRRAAR